MCVVRLTWWLGKGRAGYRRREGGRSDGAGSPSVCVCGAQPGASSPRPYPLISIVTPSLPTSSFKNAVSTWRCCCWQNQVRHVLAPPAIAILMHANMWETKRSHIGAPANNLLLLEASAGVFCSRSLSQGSQINRIVIMLISGSRSLLMRGDLLIGVMRKF